MGRRAAKVDANQGDIVKGLRAAGAEVQLLHMVGSGCVDLLVAFRGHWYVGEVKDENQPPSKRQLTDDEVKWHERFGRVAPVHIWNCLDDALKTLGAI